MSANTKGLKDLGLYDQVVDAFRKYDTNRDGTLSFQELHRLMSDLNPNRWSQRNSEVLFDSVDKNSDGCIDMQELLNHIFPRRTGMGGTSGLSDYERVTEQFRRMDTNRNGRLEKQEFTRLMCLLRPNGWSSSQTETVWASVDKDKNGTVEIGEFMSYIFGVPQDRMRAAEHRARGGHTGALVVVDFITGPGMETQLVHIKNGWEHKFGSSIGVRGVVMPQAPRRTVQKVTARDGAVVFWDRGTMLPYREDPFLNPESTKAWAQEMARRDLPRLMSGMTGARS